VFSGLILHKKNNHIIIVLLFICSLALISNTSISFSNAQTNGEPYIVNSEFKILGFGEANGEILNTSSIVFPLTSETWNLTNIELNITDIQSKREIKDIETDIFGGKDLYKGRKGLAVQINIIDPTEIYGVHIYGDENAPFTTVNVSVQINGYNSVLNQPNETIYGSTQINISSVIKWHIQNFSTPIFLNPGNYFLVMNGTEMLPQDNGGYDWFSTNNPTNPNLYISEYVGEWTNGSTGEPFLYKLDQKVVGQFYPEEINMTADIDGIYYPISDGVAPGTGFLNESIHLAPSDHNITIPIIFNKSINLIFNLTYAFNLETQLMCDGSGLINQDSPHVWTLTPIIERFYDYQFSQFFYPKNWENLTVYQKLGEIWENKTSEIFIDENTVIIPNNTLNDGIEWKITANSPNIDFNLNLPTLEWEPGQELQFTVTPPAIEGNLTFFFINSLGYGYEEPIEIREVVSEDNLFSYVIPTNSREGSYTILIYWNNNTDAGVQSQEFQLAIPPVPFTIDPIWIVISVILVIAIGTASIFSYQKIKKYRNRKIEEARKLYDKCMDVLNLDYIIVSDKKSGLNVYQQKFTETQIDAAMISGFLQAIHSFGIELIKIEDTSQTIKLEYKDSIIIMTEFVNLRLILIMKEHPSSVFLYSLEDLTYDLYKYYGKLVEEFSGDIKPFKSIEKLLKHHLNTTITYPIILTKIDKLEKVKLSQTERAFVNKAISFMKSNNSEHFFLNSLLPGKECSPKDIEIIINLIEKNVFQIF